MLSRRNTFALAAVSMAVCLASAVPADADSTSPVIEVVTLQLKPGVTAKQFEPVDKAIENEHISRMPGFLSRESAPGDDGKWLVIVHWKSLADADASMKSFASAPAAAQFMSMIVPTSMSMTRYEK